MRALAAAVIGLAIAACVHAQDGGADPLVTELAKARRQGCRGHAGTAAPLQWSPELARAAQRMARGETPVASLEKEGYRVTRVFHANFKGYRTAGDVSKVMAQEYCNELTTPAFTDVAVHRRGANWLVVLAARLQVPALADRRAVASKVLELVNDARAHRQRCGDQWYEPAPPVHHSELLEQAAAQHAQDMAAHGYLEHQARDGSTPAQRISRTGYRWRMVGENIAAGQATPEDVVQDWLESPGHCANLMNAGYLEMGVAFAVNMNAKAVVYWAQEFGRAR
jgi:uncharacterized protein YkwD